ncbi:MAG: DUF1015 domain-containing protein [Bacteroidia bacterium]
MAHIRPFRAWRYNEEKLGNIEPMFSPLFDVVSPEQLELLYSNPSNSIHLSVPESDAAVMEKLQDWKANGVLHQDPLPAIYIYYQEFSLFGESKKYVRKGFVSMIQLDTEATDERNIILHEGTIETSVLDRTRLLRQTLLNVAPTHGLYHDPHFRLEALMDAYMAHPMHEYLDYQGVVNKFALVQDRRDIALFQEVIAEGPVYLADGHHRLASSMALYQQAIAEGKELPHDSAWGYHMMFLSNTAGDDLRILPIHRVWELPEKTHNPNPILNRMRDYFEVNEVTFDRVPIYTRVLESPRTYGFVIGSLQFLIRLRDEIDPLRDIPLDLPDAVKALDYTVLHYFVFEKVFGVPYAEQRMSNNVQYLKDVGLAVKQVVTYRQRLAFIMPGCSMGQMMAVCESGALMPQKSTYFYPKVVCGLLFGSIDDDENNSPFDLSFRLPEASATAP